MLAVVFASAPSRLMLLSDERDRTVQLKSSSSLVVWVCDTFQSVEGEFDRS